MRCIGEGAGLFFEKTGGDTVKAVRWLDKYFEAVLVGVGIAVIVIVMTAQIVYRRIFGNSIIWSEELCRHIFICTAFWGLSYTIRTKGAIKFDTIVTFFPEWAKLVFEIISNVIVVLFFAYLLLPSWRVVVSMANTKSTALPYNLDLLYFLSFTGIALSGVRALQMIVLDFRELMRSGKAKEEEET